MNTANIFEKIYENKLWNCGSILSGAGSDPIGAHDYITFLHKYKDRSIIDLGCGDLSIYNKNVFFKNYIAVDIVDMSKYVSFNNIQFVQSDILSFDFNKYNFNLIIIKDVFQHLSNQTILNILNKLKFVDCEILITNDFNSSKNEDCLDGEYRRLNLSDYPFNINLINKYTWISKIDGRVKETITCNLFNNNE